MSGDGRHAGALAVDGGDLGFSSGLLALLRPALDLASPGAVLAVLSSAPSVRDDLPRWSAVEGHEYLGREVEVDGRDRHLVARGRLSVVEEDAGAAPRPHLEDGRLTAAEILRRAPLPASADPATGFAPRGARVEVGGPRYPFDLVDRDRVAPPEVARLYDQAVSSQWDGTRDIAWERVRPLPEALERALGQVMTFLAENELSALYVPARFIPRIHPAYAETAMFLATQLADEARHIDVFLKRARAGGGRLGVSSVTTSRSLLTLLEIRDFTEASFLLSVLGEGTFLDLLRFVETHAPDEPTADLVRRARNDETRHVHFGMAHVRHALAHDASLYARLEDAVRRRAASIPTSDAPAPVVDALTVLAAKGTEPGAVARGHEAVRALLEEMHANRTKRLVTAGFTPSQASTLSDLHTPNFM